MRMSTKNIPKIGMSYNHKIKQVWRYEKCLRSIKYISVYRELYHDSCHTSDYIHHINSLKDALKKHLKLLKPLDDPLIIRLALNELL